MSLLDDVRETMRRDRVFDFVAENRFPFIQGRRAVRPDQVDISHGPILYMENITVSFDGFKALNDLTLYIEAGELRCIIGPNGAGKTTMMDIITGKTRPDEGSVFYGQRIDLLRLREPEIAQAGIGRKFQKPTVFEYHSVYENLELATRTNKAVWPTLFAQLSGEQRDGCGARPGARGSEAGAATSLGNGHRDRRRRRPAHGARGLPPAQRVRVLRHAARRAADHLEEPGRVGAR